MTKISKLINLNIFDVANDTLATPKLRHCAYTYIIL